jgi:starvation-inducible outer membrane lipoprotein
MRLSILFVALLLAACANLPADPSKMTAEQLTAWAKDKNANIACSTYKGLYGTGVVNYVVLDKGIVVNGTVVLDPECKVTITNTVTKP